jgi:hypothetical protein
MVRKERGTAASSSFAACQELLRPVYRISDHEAEWAREPLRPKSLARLMAALARTPGLPEEAPVRVLSAHLRRSYDPARTRQLYITSKDFRNEQTAVAGARFLVKLRVSNRAVLLAMASGAPRQRRSTARPAICFNPRHHSGCEEEPVSSRIDLVPCGTPRRTPPHEPHQIGDGGKRENCLLIFPRAPAEPPKLKRLAGLDKARASARGKFIPADDHLDVERIEFDTAADPASFVGGDERRAGAE